MPEVAYHSFTEEITCLAVTGGALHRRMGIIIIFLNFFSLIYKIEALDYAVWQNLTHLTLMV